MPSTRCSTGCWRTAAFHESTRSTACNTGCAEAGGCGGSGRDPGLLLRQDEIFVLQLLAALHAMGILRDAIHRTDFLALGPVVMAHTFGALAGIDDVNRLPLRNRVVRAFE